MVRRVVLRGLGIFLGFSVPAFAAACHVELLASVPVTLAGRTPLVTVMVDGQPARFILDTGAERTVVSEAAAARLGLPRDKWVGTTMGGVGGVNSRPNALPRSLSLGGVALVRNTLNHDTSLVVTPTLRGVPLTVADGLLGRDFLSVFDLDLDTVHRTLGLETVHDCAGRFLPWHGPYAAMPATLAMGGAVILPVVLDGRPLRALLDTGASSSLLAAPGMFRMGLTVATVADDPSDVVSGVGPRSVVMRRHRFGALSVAGKVDAQPEIWVAPVHLVPIVDLLLGMDWLAGREVWISYATRQVFVR
ncbi:MAG TPA: retroviral-like aspartic protease family protein [Rhodopila sp.]|uniref:retroviral-like aspartic protease family protein n=1 Tax=Rhodopila sp. TaxID=2480087 RepID=UPI002BC9D356|nr:retroviral-like aspartic protease family protein [Rhodopila sp.]HVY17945.1 retroviral-like aspartic protease family protein [Rhodopila sp.]